MKLEEQLRLLSIFHYVVGGLHALLFSIGLIHCLAGLMMIIQPETFQGSNQSAPPAFFAWAFFLFGGGFVLFGWTMGALTAVSGWCIAKRRNYTFCIVMGAVNCALFPFGTVLGVFDLILLTKSEAKQLYEETSPVPSAVT